MRKVNRRERDEPGATGTARPDLSVVLAHPDEEVRGRLAGELEAAGITVVAAVADVATAGTAVVATVPDVAVLALDLGAADDAGGAVDLCRELTAALPACPLLVVSAAADGRAHAALLAGAGGALALDDPAAPVPDAVRRVRRGEGLATPAAATAMLAEAVTFSASEREVLTGLAGGATLAAIAGRHEVPAHHVGLHAGTAIARVRAAATAAVRS